MAFDRSNFTYSSIGQGSNAPKIHSYRTTADNKVAVGGSGYFNDLADQLEVGDFIMTDASDGMEVTGVATNDGTTVTTISVALA
jgi:hypothetical protein